ncbi:hypothetical protein CRM22_009350 [Opisthorchis felineus]|uniref:Uncharacterized protein n=1 Tax=Opisthorchis felineus TaxID=147828 RepID=A0A4S2LF20_OPIFE|nr:hypothetical protein CRM22_009350 [Opisthorchis felineus]
MEEPESHPPKPSTRMSVPYGESTNSDNPMTDPIYGRHRSCSQCGRMKRSASTLNMENHCQQCDILNGETENAQSFPSMRPVDIDSPWLNSDIRPNPVRNPTHRQSSTLHHRYSLKTLPKFSDKRSQMYQTRLSEENKLNRYYSLRTPLRTQMRQIRTPRHAPHPDPLLPRYSGRCYGTSDNTVTSSSRYFGRQPNDSGFRPWNLDFPTQSGYYGRRIGGSFYEGLDQPGMNRRVSNDDESLVYSERNAEARTRNFPYTEHHCSSNKYDITDWSCEKRRGNRTCSMWNKCDSTMFANDRAIPFQASRRHESCCNSRLYEDCDILESDAEGSEDFDIRRTCSHRMFSPSIPDEEEFTHEQCYHSKFCECNREQENLSYPRFMCKQQRPYLHERTARRFASITR